MENSTIPNPELHLSLMILDCIACPWQSLAEAAEGTKAMCSALTDILWFSDYVFTAETSHPRPVKMTVIDVSINHAATDRCNFSVEITYEHSRTREEILATIKRNTRCKFSIRENILALQQF